MDVGERAPWRGAARRSRTAPSAPNRGSPRHGAADAQRRGIVSVVCVACAFSAVAAAALRMATLQEPVGPGLPQALRQLRERLEGPRARAAESSAELVDEAAALVRGLQPPCPPTPPPQTPEPPSDRQYLAFPWNLGRVNNNMVAFSAALSVSKMTGRTLLVIAPPASRRAGDGFNYLGVQDRCFDLDTIRSGGYSVLLHEDVPAQLLDQVPGKGEWVEGDPQDTLGTRCVLDADGGGYWPTQQRRAQAELRSAAASLGSCKVLYLKRPFSFMGSDFQEARGYVRPARWLRVATEMWLKSRFPPDGIPPVSVHQRHHAWANEKEHGSKFLCRADRGPSRNIWGSHAGAEYREAVKVWRPDNQQQRDRMLAVTQLSCGLNYTDLRTILAAWRKAVPARFFLASDGEMPASLHEMKKHGGVTLTSKAVPRTGDLVSSIASARDCRKWFCPTSKSLQQHALVLMDLWAMAKGDYFVGGYYSTMSESVCYVRGKEKRGRSQFCFLADRLREKAVDPLV